DDGEGAPARGEVGDGFHATDQATAPRPDRRDRRPVRSPAPGPGARRPGARCAAGDRPAARVERARRRPTAPRRSPPWPGAARPRRGPGPAGRGRGAPPVTAPPPGSRGPAALGRRPAGPRRGRAPRDSLVDPGAVLRTALPVCPHGTAGP